MIYVKFYLVHVYIRATKLILLLRAATVDWFVNKREVHVVL